MALRLIVKTVFLHGFLMYCLMFFSIGLKKDSGSSKVNCPSIMNTPFLKFREINGVFSDASL